MKPRRFREEILLENIFHKRSSKLIGNGKKNVKSYIYETVYCQQNESEHQADLRQKTAKWFSKRNDRFIRKLPRGARLAVVPSPLYGDRNESSPPICISPICMAKKPWTQYLAIPKPQNYFRPRTGFRCHPQYIERVFDSGKLLSSSKPSSKPSALNNIGAWMSNEPGEYIIR
jgi:hypothetical protein